MAGVRRAGRPLFNLVLTSLAAALAACAQPPPPPPPKPVAALPRQLPLPPPVRRRPIPRPAHKPEAPPEAPPEAVAMVAPEPASPPPPVVTPRASELIGLDQKAASRLFGAAAETAEEPPATVWRWRSATCELELFFYLDLRSGRMRSLRYAFKGGDGGSAEPQDCLRSLATARRT